MSAMLRRFLILVFILGNLSSQVSVAFACGMLAGAPVVLEHCCCPQVAAPGNDDDTADGKGCCRKLVEISAGFGDQASNVAAPVKLPAYEPQILPPALLPALFSIALPAPSQAMAREESGGQGLYGTDLYLRTQRLRL